MSHTMYGPSGNHYYYNPDMSGAVRYQSTVDTLHGPICVVVEIPGEDVLELAAQYVRSMKIEQLEQSDNKQILGVKN